MMDRDDKFWHDLNEREEAWAYEKAEFDKIAHYVMMKKSIEQVMEELKAK